MKKIILSSVIVFALLFSKFARSQSWVEMMQDPTVNFYDVQKTFNKQFHKKEKEMQREHFDAFQKQQKAAAKIAKNGIVVPLKGLSNIAAEGEEEKEGELPGWELFKRWENFMMPRLFPSGDRSLMTAAWNEYLDSYYAGPTRAAGPSTPTPMAANWTLIGPTTSIPSGGGGAGRVNFVRFDPTNTNNIFVGSPGGGLWKSTTGGTAWSTNTDQLAVIGCTDLAIHPTVVTTMYLATGDGEAQDTYSIGVLKTTDGGTTWLPTGLTWAVTNGRTISRLLINPQNPNTIFAATSNGVYRSLNAGAAWTQIATAIANMKDIEFKPGDTTTVYACSTTLFYKSVNGGTTFATTSTGLPAAASLSRLSIAVTAMNPLYVYVLGANTAYGFQGLYRSVDNGATFTTRSTTPNILGYSNTGATAGGQGWYDLALAVSPINQDLVIVGGVNIWKSINGGTGWTLNAEWTGTGAPYVHADIHALEFLPASATTYFAGCDGGCFKTINTGTAWSDLSNGLQIAQAYRIGLSTTNANLLNTGWQDNGTARWTGTAAWTRPLGGDGMECIVDWSNANVQYGELYYGDIRKTTTAGNYTTQIVASGGVGVNADGDWVTPYIEAPTNAATLFVGKAQVYKSINSGGTWAQVGTVSGGTGNIIALANAASNINYIYAAKINRFYTCTTGTAFVDRTAGLPTASAAISYISVDPLNANRVWVTFSGYSAANKVWYSADAGVTWSNYSTGLPNLPANCIVYQGSSTNDPLYVGTDVGVYYRDNTSGSWTPYNTGLPNVSVRELEIQYTALKLRAATFGRSIWQSDLYNPGAALPFADFTTPRTNICIGECINFTDLSSGSPTSWSWSFPGGIPATSTVQNPTSICYATAGTYNVTLTATNVNGSNSITKTGYITVSGVIALPLVEGFQTTFIPPGWQLVNPDADFTWAQTTTAGGFGTSTQSAVMDNLTPPTSTVGYIDEMVTPKYDFSSVSTATMTFDVAYERYSAVYTDSLRVFVSTDCGATWTAVYNKGGWTGLQTGPDNSTTVFVPTAAQWRTETVSMTPYVGLPNVMVKFQNRSGWGQMMYLDNINITGTGAPVASVVITQTAGTNPMCAGTSATFTATPTNGGSTPTYQWQINGINIGGATLPTYTTTALVNADIVTCIMTSNLPGVTGSPATSNVITMTVNPIPATPTPGSNSPVCAGSIINLTSFTVAGATYSWTGPSAFTSALEDPTRPGATAVMAGTYSLTVTVGGCTSLPGTTTVVVNAIPTTPTAGSNSPVCIGSTINLTSNTVVGATYSWIGPSAFSSALEDPTRPSATVAMAGTYSLTVTVGGCTSLVATTAVVVNATPATPTAGSNTPVCAGSTINLTTPTVVGATYSWIGPLAYTSSLQNPSIASATAGMAGTYSVTVTVGGCTSLVATTAVVVNATPATPTAGSNTPVCTGSTINLTTPTVVGATYSWTGPLAYTSSLQNPSIASATAGMAGTYNVTVTVSGCTSLAGTTTVVVNATPATPTAGSNTPVCAGSTINLTTPTVVGATYSWTGPLAYTSSLQNPSIASATAGMAGTYSVTITVAGCTSLAGTTAVVVNAIPATPTAGSNSPVCTGLTINLTTPLVAGATYSWTGPSAFASALQNPTRPSATAAMAGTYSVTVTVSGCTSLAGTTTVVVNATPATPTVGSNSPVCVGSTINLTTLLVAGATYSWTGPLAFVSALQNPTRPSVTAGMAGTYNVTVTVAGCTSLAGTTAVVVNAIPATPTAGSNSPVCAGSTINLTTPTVVGATYSWTGPLAYTSSLQNPSIASATAGMAGTYSVTVTVAGCTSLAGTTTVVVNASPATPTAGSNSPVCVGSTINLTTPLVVGATYAWTGPLAYTSILQNPNIAGSTAGMAGTYSVTTTVAGCTSAAGTTTVVVNPTVIPSLVIAITAGSNPTCAGQSITFTATPTNGGTIPSYQWQVDGFNVGTNSTTYITTTLTTGQIVTCILTSNAVCASPLTATSNSTTITVNSTLVPAVSIAITAGTNPSCTGQSITFTATPTNGGTTPSYQWQVNGSNAGTNSTTYTTTTLTTGQTVTCIMTSSSPCASPASGTSTGITITVNLIPATPTATATTPVCSGSTIIFTTPTVVGATYSWTGPSSFTSALQNPTRPSATTAMAGTYSVTVTVGGCTSAFGITAAVVVNTTPATPVPSSNSPVCLGSNILLTTPIVAGATYSWTGPNSYTAGVRNPPAFVSTALSAGTYSLTVTVGGCTSVVGTTTVIVNPIPATPTATATTPVCTGSTIIFTTPAVAGAIYSWTGPSAFVSALQNPTRLGATTVMAGTYSVTVTLSGCTSTAGMATVIVNTTPTTPIPSSNSPVCLGSNIILTTPTVAGATYSWIGPNSYSAAVRTPPAFASSALSAGTYSLTVTVGGCTSGVGTTIVFVNPLPTTPTAGSNSPVCVGSTIDLTTPTVAGATYSWTGPSTYTSSTQNPNILSVTTAMAGTYSITVTVGGCTSLAGTTVVVVNTTVTPSVTVAESPTGAICAGTAVLFTATASGGGATPAYQWQVDGLNVGTNNPTYTDATLANGQVVTCILTSSSSCASPTTGTSTGITMTVNPAVVPTISIAIGSGSNPTCAGVPVTFMATITNGGASPSYQWQINGANAGTDLATFTSTTFNNGDVVTCILTSNATCASPATLISNSIAITVNPIPPTPTITESGMVLTSSSATGNQWYLNGVLIPGDTNQTYIATANGTYTVVVTIAGCSSAISSPIIITTTGINEAGNLFELTVSPNPNDGNFVISFNASILSTYKVELINTLGQLIFKDELKDFKGEYKKNLSVVDYGKGVYTISITNSKNEIVKKIIVY